VKYSNGMITRVSNVETKIPKNQRDGESVKNGIIENKNAPIMAAKPVQSVEPVIAELTTAL
jgi:hypothetical protein